MNSARPLGALLQFAAVPVSERCEICGQTLSESHEHVLSVRDAAILCACLPCAALLGAEDGAFRRIHYRARPVEAATSDAAPWRLLGIPVGLAALVRDASGAMRALYPGPLGVVEAAIDAEAWEAVQASAPSFGDFAPEVEAFLMDRTTGAARYFHVSLDVVYALVGLLRRHRSSSSGAVRDFLFELGVRARAAEVRA